MDFLLNDERGLRPIVTVGVVLQPKYSVSKSPGTDVSESVLALMRYLSNKYSWGKFLKDRLLEGGPIWFSGNIFSALDNSIVTRPKTTSFSNFHDLWKREFVTVGSEEDEKDYICYRRFIDTYMTDASLDGLLSK